MHKNILQLARRRTSRITILASVVVCAVIFLSPSTSNVFVHAQSQYIDASQVVPKVEIFFSPATATFQEGSLFEVPIFINTKGVSVNTIDLKIKFDASRLEIVEPSAGKSIISLWLEAPVYDNQRGTVQYMGGIPSGINSASGLIASITFRSKRTGEAVVSIQDTSRILLNDGVGSAVGYESNRGTYSIVPRPPEGVSVFSQTHPFQDRWYNNPSPSVAWNQDPGVTGFSYVLDNRPTTIPESRVKSENSIVSFDDLPDGLWYFHIKAQKQGVWGGTTHFLLRIDSTPPAEFTPKLNYLSAAVINRLLVSFFTTDSLSGIDHYEVGVIDSEGDPNQSPVFVQTESPYHLPFSSADKVRIIVRAFDGAGNIRDSSVEAEATTPWLRFLIDHGVVILVVLALALLHYLFGHHALDRMKLALIAAEKKRSVQKSRHKKGIVLILGLVLKILSLISKKK